MKYKAFTFILILSTTLLMSCSLMEGIKGSESPEDEFPEEVSEAYTAELLSEGFKFCPNSSLTVEIKQAHEITQFNYSNYVHVTGQLPLETFGLNEMRGLRTKGDIDLSGEGWAGVCQFKSSGAITFQLQARLIPGEAGQPNLLINGMSESAMTTKPPCGDFGMMPLEKTIHIIIPYRDGATTSWEWENRSAGVSGSALWTLNLPCER